MPATEAVVQLNTILEQRGIFFERRAYRYVREELPREAKDDARDITRHMLARLDSITPDEKQEIIDDTKRRMMGKEDPIGDRPRLEAIRESKAGELGFKIIFNDWLGIPDGALPAFDPAPIITLINAVVDALIRLLGNTNCPIGRTVLGVAVGQ